MNVQAMREAPNVHERTAKSCVMRRQVEHSDVDGYGVVHFARYAAFAETAALRLLHDIGFGIAALQANGIELRVRKLNLNYRAAASFADNLIVEANTERIGVAHLNVGVRIKREGDEPEPPTLVDGELDMVFVSAATGRPVAVPRI